MSVQALYTAATGMEALQTKLDIISHNMANLNTTAFKESRANFEDLFYQQEILPGIQDSIGNVTPTGIAIGLGTRIQSTQLNFTQGAFIDTGRELDMAIAGDGFFQIVDPSGQILYSRAGNFSINANGDVVVGSASDGRLIEPAINIPQDTTEISISPEGLVFVRQFGQQQLSQIGQIQLAKFINNEGLLPLGENLYQQTDASNPPTVIGNPGQNGLGLIRQTFLEASNVNAVDELIDLITTQRSFELNSQMVQAGDQMLQLVANLRRF